MVFTKINYFSFVEYHKKIIATHVPILAFIFWALVILYKFLATEVCVSLSVNSS